MNITSNRQRSIRGDEMTPSSPAPDLKKVANALELMSYTTAGIDMDMSKFLAVQAGTIKAHLAAQGRLTTPAQSDEDFPDRVMLDSIGMSNMLRECKEGGVWYRREDTKGSVEGPYCRCGDGFTTDALCINCQTADAAGQSPAPAVDLETLKSETSKKLLDDLREAWCQGIQGMSFEEFCTRSVIDHLAASGHIVAGKGE